MSKAKYSYDNIEYSMNRVRKWADRYDWTVERKIAEAIGTGLFLGLLIDFIVLVVIKL